MAAVAHGGLAEAGLPGIEVADTRRALGALAAGWRTTAGRRNGVTGAFVSTTSARVLVLVLRCTGAAGASS